MIYVRYRCYESVLSYGGDTDNAKGYPRDRCDQQFLILFTEMIHDVARVVSVLIRGINNENMI